MCKKRGLTSFLQGTEGVSICSLQFLDIDGSGTFGTSFNIKADLFPRNKGFKAGAAVLDGGVVDEYVRALSDGDKTVPFGIVEPLYRSMNHVAYLFSQD
jgi:hypothetical protein